MPTVDEVFASAVQKHQAGDVHEAMRLYEAILAAAPEHAGALHLLGVAFHQTGDNAAAIQRIQAAIDIDAGQARYFYNLGVILEAETQRAEARRAYERALALDPNETSARNNLANLLMDLGEFGGAERLLREALTGVPRWSSWLVRLGEILKMQGRAEEAIPVLRAALQIRPDDARVHSVLLFALQYFPGVSLADLAQEHRAWAQHHTAGLTGSSVEFSDRDANPERPLRLGFVSPDFFYHPVGLFLAPVIERLDREQFHVVCYANGGRRDAMSQRLAAAGDLWREVGGWSDDELCRTIREDAIDILFDLAGHTDNNRLPAFARRLAPVQITWAGYVGTTGLETIDYLLGDAQHVPESAEPFYCEKMLRMPDGYVCYEPPEYAPEPGPPPIRSNGYATFGSLNNPSKFSSAAVRCWSEILRRLPDSRLILKYKGCDEPATCRRLKTLFAEHGIDEQRLDLRGNTTHVEHLRVYREIDVALDPFPYSGGITTCEATWMGVPTVTCPGETFASRHSLSHLTNAGVAETIARDHDHYAELAVGLASDLERLSQLRASLRSRMAASPLCDAVAFGKAFEQRMRAVWRDCCAHRA